MTWRLCVVDEYKSDDDGGQRKAAHALSKAQMQVSELLDAQVTQIETILTNLASMLSKEVQDARDIKGQCYEALNDMDHWRGKVQQTFRVYFPLLCRPTYAHRCST